MENIVCIELIRRKKEVYYWKGKNEVDFIVKEMDHTLQAINVSYTDEIEEREQLGLREFKHEYKEREITLLLLTKDKREKIDDIEIKSLWEWLVG